MENITLVTPKDSKMQVTMPTIPKPPKNEVPLHVKFLTAGVAACMADLVTFPLDTAKVRLQIQGESTTGSAASAAVGASTKHHRTAKLVPDSAIKAAKKSPAYRGVIGTMCTISKQEGPKALYSGLAPGLQRQMAFASVRIGLYDSVKQIYANALQSHGLAGTGFGVRILAGCTTGALAVTVAQPTDVVKVRMQAQRANAPKRYNGVFHAYRTIAVQEGTKGLWKGTSANVARNCIVNCSELVSYDLFKEFLLTHNILSDSFPCHVVSAFGAGFVTTIIGSPVDVVKTRYMNSADGTYKGVIDCAVSMAKQEGPKAFYKGFMPSFMRLASWNVVMFVCYEQLKSHFSKPAPTLPSLEIESKRFM